jgi:hypothetical protein
MNFRLFTLPGTLLVAMAFLFTACTKEGPTGPAGATGPAGPAGPAGPTGPAGTANVIYSNWLDVAFKADTVMTGTVIDTLGFEANITANGLTSAILNTGEMKVYANFGTATQPRIVPLPYTENYTVYGYPVVFTITPTFFLQRINLYSDYYNPSTVTNANGKFLQYRYVLIPGGTATGRVASINWNDYNEVKAYLGLKD